MEKTRIQLLIEQFAEEFIDEVMLKGGEITPNEAKDIDTLGTICEEAVAYHRSKNLLKRLKQFSDENKSES